jgi:ketosteroid isomerase-like protein
MPATPTEVMYALIDGVTGKKWDDLPPLYAEDTVVEHPMNVPAPSVLHGREALRRHFDGARDMPMDMSAHDIVVHQTTDPETVIGEFEYHVRPHSPDAKEFVVRNIYVLTVRDGLILRSRDYADHLAFAVGMSRLTQLVDTLQPA